MLNIELDLLMDIDLDLDQDHDQDLDQDLDLDQGADLELDNYSMETNTLTWNIGLLHVSNRKQKQKLLLIFQQKCFCTSTMHSYWCNSF